MLLYKLVGSSFVNVEVGIYWMHFDNKILKWWT